MCARRRSRYRQIRKQRNCGKKSSLTKGVITPKDNIRIHKCQIFMRAQKKYLYYNENPIKQKHYYFLVFVIILTYLELIILPQLDAFELVPEFEEISIGKIIKSSYEINNLQSYFQNKPHNSDKTAIQQQSHFKMFSTHLLLNLNNNSREPFSIRLRRSHRPNASVFQNSNAQSRIRAVFTPSSNRLSEIKSEQRKVLTNTNNSGFSITSSLCLGIEDIFIALFLILLILTTILGNILVVLSVFMYKRMRTFNNFLLTSLATADLLVGLLIMPLSLVDLLHHHNWPFGRLLCRIWATSDVLLCTASILNLCIISLDRYMAITSPLKYPRTRSRIMAFGLLCFVWGVAMIVCSPPWFIRKWDLFYNRPEAGTESNFICAYSPSVPYRIYSALCSFYIPLMVMLSVYFKIFRVASERERLMRQSLGTCRLSRRVEKTQRNNNNIHKNVNNIHYSEHLHHHHHHINSDKLLNNNYHNRCTSEPISRMCNIHSTQELRYSKLTSSNNAPNATVQGVIMIGRLHSNSFASFPHSDCASIYLAGSISSVVENKVQQHLAPSTISGISSRTPSLLSATIFEKQKISTHLLQEKNNNCDNINCTLESGTTSSHYCIRKSQSTNATIGMTTQQSSTTGDCKFINSIAEDKNIKKSSNEVPRDVPSDTTVVTSATITTIPDNTLNLGENNRENIENNENNNLEEELRIGQVEDNEQNRFYPTADMLRSTTNSQSKTKITELLENEMKINNENENQQQQDYKHNYGNSLAITTTTSSAISSPFYAATSSSSSFSRSSSTFSAQSALTAIAGRSPSADVIKQESEYDNNVRMDIQKNSNNNNNNSNNNNNNNNPHSKDNNNNTSDRNLIDSSSNIVKRLKKYELFSAQNSQQQKQQKYERSLFFGPGKNNSKKGKQYGPQSQQQLQRSLWMSGNRLQPVNLLAKAQQHYQINGPGKNIRGSKEKIVYLRERKALKTIGIVVLGFIICWMPFFVLYLLEVFIAETWSDSYIFKLINEFFLWLGYSNSVLNPIIYTMYNGDFRRCFRDLLGFGCIQHHRRTMSVKKLHQQSTVF